MQSYKAAFLFISLAIAVSTGSAHRHLLQAPAPAPGPGECITVAQAAQDAGLSLLLAAVTRAGLTTALADPGLRYTVFAPEDAAFTKANLTEEQILAAPQAEVEAILNNHLLAYPLRVFDLVAAGNVTTQDNGAVLTIENETIGNEEVAYVTPAGGDVEARIVVPNVQACQSIVHVIDEILIPTSLA